MFIIISYNFPNFKYSEWIQGGPWRPGPPTPVKTSQNKDSHCVGLQVLQVIGPPLGQISGSATDVYFLSIMLFYELVQQILTKCWSTGKKLNLESKI